MIESTILKILQQCQDLGSTSEELSSRIIDRHTNLHLNPARANLLRPFEFGPQDTILEVGAGCGALTRWLVETGATVVALESDPVGRRCITERCRDVRNPPSVYRSLANLNGQLSFTVVLCVGPIDEAEGSSYTSGSASEFLRHLADPLTQKGRLFLASRNQLGLASLLRHGDDDQISQSHGKRELSDLLTLGGFHHLEWYYPFPDHLFPSLILSQASLDDPRLNLADHFLDSFAKSVWTLQSGAWESLIWRAVMRNGLLEHFSNSFMVVATKQVPVSQEAHVCWLIKNYATGRNRYLTETTFLSRDSCIVKSKSIVTCTRVNLNPA
jgi:hypothetical protein